MPESILIVDETPTNRRLAQRVLASAGYNVRGVPDAAAALESMPEFQPRLVLTDLRLAGMDGLALTRRIKSDPQTRQTLVIALTGCNTEEDRRAALDAGCDDFIVKPIDTRSLPVVVQAHLARQEQDAAREAAASEFTAADLPSWAVELCRDFLGEGITKTSQILQGGLGTAEILRAAHLWAGLGGTFGYPEITRLARHVESLLVLSYPAHAAEIDQALELLAAAFSQAAAAGAGTDAAPPLPSSLVQALAGKKFALAGFDSHDAARLSRLLERAGVLVLGFAPGDIAAADLVLAAAESGFQPDSGKPLLLVGTPRSGPPVDIILDSALIDFASVPWTSEEILARACRLLTRRHTPAQDPVAQPVRDRKLRVVIADDDPTILTLLKTTIQNYGMECFTASEGDHALQLIREHAPDAAVLDVIMPNMDGFEVLAAVRNDSAARNLPVLLLSAMQQEADIVRAFGLGANDYVTKPFSPVEVVARLKRLVRSEA